MKPEPARRVIVALHGSLTCGEIPLTRTAPLGRGEATMTILIPGLSSRRLFQRGARAVLRGLLRSLWNGHRRRNDLSRLSEMDDHILRDIGISRSEVQRALDTPFWHR